MNGEYKIPSYTFEHKKTGEVKNHIVSIAGLQPLVDELGADWRRVYKPLAIVSQTGSTLSKTSDGWKEVLKNVDKQSPGDNTVNY